MRDLMTIGASSAPAPVKSAKPNRKSRRRAASNKRRVAETEAPLAGDEPMPLLVPYSRAARELGCSVRHLYKLIALGKLKQVKLGRSARITRESIFKLTEVT